MSDECFEIFDLKKGYLMDSYPYSKCVDFSIQPMGEHLALACTDQWILYSFETFKILKCIEDADITCFEFHPDGILALSGHANGELKLWDIRT